jgi:hypothetical protein
MRVIRVTNRAIGMIATTIAKTKGKKVITAIKRTKRGTVMIEDKMILLDRKKLVTIDRMVKDGENSVGVNYKTTTLV